jgi:enterochelin esterase-like enzyme
MPAKPPRNSALVLSGVFLFFGLSGCSPAASGIATFSERPSATIPLTISETPVPSYSLSPAGTVDTGPAAGNRSCQENAGLVEPYQISHGGEELTGRIYTPPCYGSDRELLYPVLYLLHGATETDLQWQELGIAAEADRLIAEGEIAPLIIVLPRELTWVAVPENTFGDSLVQELVPWVDMEYRTLPDREFRAIGGLSRGGNWAVRIGLLHWGLFGSIGAHSTPLFYGDLERLPDWIELIPVGWKPRLYLDIGKDDNNLAVSRKLDALLTRLDYPHEWHLNPGLHNAAYWQGHLADYLLWYNDGWADLLP